MPACSLTWNREPSSEREAAVGQTPSGTHPIFAPIGRASSQADHRRDKQMFTGPRSRSESSQVVSNNCMSKLPLTLASCLTASVLAVTLVAQRGTDFSGSWVLDETQVRAAPDIPQRLVVEQPLTTTTNPRGEPMPPAYRTLYVKRYLGDVVQEGTYRIGLIGGTVAGIVPGQPAGGGSRYEVTWRGDSLWIYQESYGPSGANIRRGETWRIDDRGRLVISIENRENDEPATTQTLVYRRDKQ